MDNYSAVYEAVRSKIRNADIGSAVADYLRQSWDISHVVVRVQEQVYRVADEMCRPSVLFRPDVYLDGSQWCALYGRDLQEGVAGFGNSPDAALRDFDNNWQKSLPKARGET